MYYTARESMTKKKKLTIPRHTIYFQLLHLKMTMSRANPCVQGCYDPVYNIHNIKTYTTLVILFFSKLCSVRACLKYLHVYMLTHCTRMMNYIDS